MGLLKAVDDLQVWIEVNGHPGFDILVKYLTPAQIKRLSDRATKRQVNKATRQIEEVVDNDLLSKLMIREMIVDWRGLSVKHLEEMMPLDKDSKKSIETDHKGELPFSDDDLETLAEVTYSRSMMDQVMEVCTDMGAFREVQKASLGNESGA